jgi:DNA-binding LacI/PurR family transcriptional regulator
MQDIADLAGCSVMTVSLALRGSPRVSAARRAAICQLAREHGYSPNPLVSALVAQRRHPKSEAGTIALLTKFDKPVRSWQSRQPFYSDLLDGIDARARELGFKIEEFPTHIPNAPSGKQLTRILRTRRITAVLLFPGAGLNREFPELDWSHFCTVAAAFNARRMQVHRTASDYLHGMEICLAELTGRGYRRVGLAMTAKLDPNSRFMLSGHYLAWQQSLPLNNRVPLVPGEGDEPSRIEFENWVRREKPDCVMTLNAQVEEWLAAMGVEIPRQVACVSLALRGRTDMAGLDQQTAKVGCASVNLLARELYLNHFGLPDVPEVLLVSPVWREGPTVVAANPAESATRPDLGWAVRPRASTP